MVSGIGASGGSHTGNKLASRLVSEPPHPLPAGQRRNNRASRTGAFLRRKPRTAVPQPREERRRSHHVGEGRKLVVSARIRRRKYARLPWIRNNPGNMATTGPDAD